MHVLHRMKGHVVQSMCQLPRVRTLEEMYIVSDTFVFRQVFWECLRLLQDEVEHLKGIGTGADGPSIRGHRTEFHNRP
jgi:hypothetical protein